MSVKLNGAGNTHARSLVASGKIDKTSAWSMSADDENALLGDNDWKAYGSWHLGVDDGEPEDTKAHYKYPFGKGGKVYRSALVAIRQRAGQQDAKDIFDAAGRLLESVDGKSGDKDSRMLSVGALCAPWAIMRECMELFANGVPAPILGALRGARMQPMRAEGIAIIPLHGAVDEHSSGGFFGGGASLDDFAANMHAALADESVSGIVLDIDSPGGSVYGTQNAASLVYGARSAKPIYAVANSLAASAAYWIGSQASKFYATPGGEVGSVGVFAVHSDVSRALDGQGVTQSLISAGKYKTEGNPFEPLSSDGRAYIQGRVDDYYGQFTRDVARGRGVSVETVRGDTYGGGRVLGAAQAKAAGMIDAIGTLGQAVSALRRDIQIARTPAARHAQRMREIEILGG